MGEEVRGTFVGWPSEARALVERAIATHGGFELWRSVASIRLPFETGAGMLLALKGYRRTFPGPREYEVRPHERSVIFHGYPGDEHRGRFVDGSVSIESLREPSDKVEKPHHRDSFRGLAKYRRWNHFFGYALWHCWWRVEGAWCFDFWEGQLL